MRNYLILFFACLLFAQSNAQVFMVQISDNNGVLYQQSKILIDEDSVIVTGKSDYGRTNVDFLHKAISKQEKNRLSQFLNKFNSDSLQSLYFNEYTNYKFIDAEHAPREIEVKLFIKGKFFMSKVVNAHVRLLNLLFNEVNLLLPEEVKIKYNNENFNAFY